MLVASQDYYAEASGDGERGGRLERRIRFEGKRTSVAPLRGFGVTLMCVLRHSAGVAADVVMTVEKVAMCLAIPRKILEIQEAGRIRAARVQFGGVVRQASLVFVPEAEAVVRRLCDGSCWLRH